jgi:ribosomal protein S18
MADILYDSTFITQVKTITAKEVTDATVASDAIQAIGHASDYEKKDTIVKNFVTRRGKSVLPGGTPTPNA